MPGLAFLEWWDLLGTGIQSIFAWVTFNRDAFADNVGWRQAQKYQQKNYHISWIAVARDDIRDMMGISVNRINNYMLVATLILSAACGALTSASFNTSCPAFLVYAFLTCIAISICFLTLSIMFGIKGQNIAFTKTMQLLTFQVRPENPADYNHDYMKQAQWIEKKGLKELFRIPGLMPNYANNPMEQQKLDAALPETLRKRYVMNKPGGLGGLGTMGDAPSADKHLGHQFVREDATPLENLDVSSNHLWYLTKFADFMRLWMPYDKFAKYSMGLGIISLGQGAAYFCIASLLSQGWGPLPEYAAVTGCFCFTYMIVIVIQTNVKHVSVAAQVFLGCLLWMAPCLSVIGAVTHNDMVVDIVVPAGFLCHSLFWLASFMAAFRLGQGEKDHLRFVNPTTFWDEKKLERQTEESSRTSSEHKRPGEKIGRRDTDDDWGMWEDTPGQDPDSNADRPALGAMGAGGSHAHWPTDDPEFLPKVSETTGQVTSTLRLTLFVSFAVWGLLTVWAFHRMLIQDASSPFFKRFVMSEKALAVSGWPTLFRPHAVDCAGEHVFLADEYRVFELRDGKLDEFPCALNSTIADITVSCDSNMACKPLVLSDSIVVDCATMQSMPLLQETVQPDFIAMYNAPGQGPAATEQKLVIAHGEKLVMYRWNQLQDGWQPEWQLGDLAEPSLRSISVDGDKLVLFNAKEVNNIAVHRRSLGTMQMDGSWALGETLAPLTSGCARQQGNSALILPLSASPPGALKPLAEVTLAS